MEDTECVSIERLREIIAELKGELKTWQAVGDHFGINKTTAWRIVHHGYVPKDPQIRRCLNLPELITREQSRDKKGRFAKA